MGKGGVPLDPLFTRVRTRVPFPFPSSHLPFYTPPHIRQGQALRVASPALTDISGRVIKFGVEDVREKMMSGLPPSVIGEGDVERNVL